LTDTCNFEREKSEKERGLTADAGAAGTVPGRAGYIPPCIHTMRGFNGGGGR